jgi:hypothetical protein
VKIIKYKYLSCEVNHGTEENPNIEQIFLDKELYCPTKSVFDANYPIAVSEAVGEITVDGEFEPEPETTDDVLNALLGVM